MKMYIVKNITQKKEYPVCSKFIPTPNRLMQIIVMSKWPITDDIYIINPHMNTCHRVNLKIKIELLPNDQISDSESELSEDKSESDSEPESESEDESESDSEDESESEDEPESDSESEEEPEICAYKKCKKIAKHTLNGIKYCSSHV